ncbi:MAG: putative 2-aminoethylphosphonate ABC transporter permease subunit, partial [Betaproteobacteria bacterium]|nr:putative 2-aminoethylphosphonate ABC transporter permease subunit [Betaproteobacteria bacterium]
MVLAMTFSSFPHALMILFAALELSDARLYEVAEALGTQRAAQVHDYQRCLAPEYGLVSVRMVVFTMAVSEFGDPEDHRWSTPEAPAVDIYKQVIGQQNF